MFGALKRGFQSTASLILVRNVVGVLQPKRILAASRGFLAAARLSCIILVVKDVYCVKQCCITCLYYGLYYYCLAHEDYSAE